LISTSTPPQLELHQSVDGLLGRLEDVEQAVSADLELLRDFLSTWATAAR